MINCSHEKKYSRYTEIYTSLPSCTGNFLSAFLWMNKTLTALELNARYLLNITKTSKIAAYWLYIIKCLVNLQSEEGKDTTKNVFFKCPWLFFLVKATVCQYLRVCQIWSFKTRGLNYEQKLTEHHKYFSTGGKYINKISDNSNTFKQLNFPQKNMLLSS